MSDKILDCINTYNMISDNDTIIVGVSGGADSMCLLNYLVSLQKILNINIIAAHINHCIRGDEALRDENFVSEQCSKLNVPLEIRRIDVIKRAEKLSMGVEECGREVRYSVFRELAEKCGGKIATAHTASDNAETILLNITRGSGLNGLRGIPPVRDRIIRPLLYITRAEVEEYCLKNSIPYIIDSSNLLHEYSRNKIRLDVMPVLKQINPGIEAGLTRLTQNASEDEKLLKQLARNTFKSAEINGGYNTDLLYDKPSPILSRGIIIIAQGLGCRKLERCHINAVIEIIRKKSGGVSLPKSLYADSSQGIFRIYRKNIQNRIDNTPLISINNIEHNGSIFSINTICIEEVKKYAKNEKKVFQNALNCDIINSNTMLRHRNPGDYYRVRGSGHKKSLKKLFNELKIPKEKRDELLLIANDNEVIWIEDIGASQASLINDRTNSIVFITKHPAIR